MDEKMKKQFITFLKGFMNLNRKQQLVVIDKINKGLK